ncbi:hypothetical protein ACNF42_07295 [Cuniculiplasma sp. SKW3]|uniref:hypothetical protein n=1 Tax=Cuniculiplasma sp. SKW3 TaxID=3400170 RepID=UPI003FD1AEA3
MATTKRAKSSRSGGMHGGMSLGAILIAVLLSAFLIVVYFSRPDISVIRSIPVITQGILAPAVFVGVLLWGVVEYSTSASKGAIVLLERFIPSFIIGALIGGYLGYELKYGQYVLNPAFSGNMYAEFYLIVSFITVFSMIWTVAWAHTHGFKGKSNGAKSLGYSESANRKVLRIMKAFIAFIILLLLIVPAGAELGSIAASGHQVSYLDGLTSATSAGPLYLNSQIISVRENSSSSSIAVDTRDVLYPVNEFDMPTQVVKNKTGADITEFYKVAYITSALTTGQINQYAMTQIDLHFSSTMHANITLGTGVSINAKDVPSPTSTEPVGAAVSTVFNGTNASSFVPVETIDMNNSTYTNFTLTPSMFLGNQNLSISYEIQTNDTSEMELQLIYVGNPSSFNVLWPYPVIQAMYLVGGVMLLAFVPVSIPMIDFPNKGGKR